MSSTHPPFPPLACRPSTQATRTTFVPIRVSPLVLSHRLIPIQTTAQSTTLPPTATSPVALSTSTHPRRPHPTVRPHTAPVETWSLDPGSVCVLPIVPVACDAFDTVDRPFDTVDRLYGGAESDSEEVDYSQDNDDACVAAQRREEFKRSHPGTAEAQEIRGDNLSMTERCRQQRIHFWPVAIEVDGAITPSFLRFFKNVCNAAKNLTGQNLSSFKHYWSKRIACEIHQFNATVRQRHHML